MSVRWGLTKETICGLMNAAPWPASAGAFNASVRAAGLLSSKTLAKADFFYWKPVLEDLSKGHCVHVCVCLFQGIESAQAASQMQPTSQPALQTYINFDVQSRIAETLNLARACT